jgi:hypothetical protein
MRHRLYAVPTFKYSASCVHAQASSSRTLLKAWSAGGVPAADAMMLSVSMDLFNSEDCRRGFVNTAKAFDLGIEPPDMVFHGR